MNRTPALAMLMAIPVILNAATGQVSISFDTAGRPYRLSVQGAPAGMRLQLVDGVDLLGVVVVDRSGDARFAIDWLPGPHTIRALEWGTGIEFGEPLHFTIPGQPANSFGVTASYATGIQPIVIQSGDLDGDGFPDLIAGATGKVILMRNQSGQFGPAVTLGAIAKPTGIAVADFNGDGRNDIAIAAADRRVAIYLNKGGGEFVVSGYFAVGANPSGVVTADFNGDGIPDLATSNQDDNSISILLGYGDGSFQPATSFPAGNSPRAISVADFNGDGPPDLATVNFGSNDVSIFLGDGKGAFQNAGSFAAGKGPVKLTVADFNEDGAPDLAVLNQIDGSLSLLLNNGSAAFRPQESIPDVSSMAAGDINGDGHADLVLQVGAEIRVQLGRGDGTFTEGFSTPAVSPPLLLVPGGFNRDGELDVAAVDPGGVLSVLLSAETGAVAATGGIQSAADGSAGSIPRAMAGNGSSSVALTAVPSSALFGQPVTLTALITPAGATGKVTFYDGTTVLGGAPISGGTATLVSIGIGYGVRQLTARYTGDANDAPALSAPITEHITTNPGGGFNFAGYLRLGNQMDVQAMAVADLNHDGYPDIAGAILNDGIVGGASVNVLLNKGDGTFQSPTPYLTGTVSHQIAIGDIDLDGNPDLIVTTTDGVVWLKGNADGTFQAASTIFSSTDLGIVLIADLNSDGYPDVIVSHTATPTIEVRLGNGDGTFQTAAPAGSSVATTIAGLAVGDFNGDGIVDLAVTIVNSVNVLEGVGDGTFLPPVSYQTNAGSLAVADVNHDGYLDIVTGNNSPNVLLGNGNGTFQSPKFVPLDPPPATLFYTLSVTDIDGDGNADIVGGDGADVHIFFGNGDGTFRAPVDQFLFTTNLLVLADFNRDGIVDVADTDSAGSPISIYSGALAPLLTLTASPSPANVGQNVVLTVNSSFAGATGTISFTDTSTGTTLGSAPLSRGTATFQVTQPARGTHVYQATYSGDSKYAATVAPLISVLVQQTIGITLSASPNPTLPGFPVTLTATMSTFPGNGTVIFMDGVVPLGYQEFYSGANSTQASLTTTLAAGVHQLRAVFPAYQGYEPASATYTENVITSGGGQLIQGESYLAGTNPTAIAAADFTGDGLTDIAVASSTGQSLSLFTGTGFGEFQPAGSTPLSFAPGAMIAVQLELNYGPWLAITDPANNAVHTFSYAGGSFSQSSTVSVGTQPVAISAADFDGDGIPDLITANAGSDDVSVLLSSKPAVTVTAGTHPDAVVVADFNGDGNADFAVANRDDNTVSVSLGNGDGTFQTLTPARAGAGPVSIAAGDLNGDGKMDLAIVDGGSGQIMILLGNGNGTFNALPAIGAPGASAITLAQLTTSGHLDLAATTSSGLMVYVGNGDGTFQPPVNYAQYAGGSTVVAAAFVLDGRMSLAVAVPGTNSVSLLLNEVPSTLVLSVTPSQGATGGEITFAISVTPSTAIGWFTVYDGTALVGSGLVSEGQGLFSTSLALPGTHSFTARFAGVGFGPSSTSAISYTVTSAATAGLASAVTQNLMNSPVNLVPGDFNNDGIEDFAFTGSGGGLFVLLGHGDGTFNEQDTGAFGGAPAVAADFNRDGFTDLGYTLIALGNGTGSFSEGYLDTLAVTPSALAAADVDGDTIPDLILANPNGTVDVLLGIGDGTFQTARVYPAGADPTALAIADLNEDGIPDIVVASNASSSAGELNVLLGTGAGNFASPQTLDVGATPVSMALADFNGDHHTDVALLHAGSNMITLLPGKGDGTFSPPSTIALPSLPAKILAADMNTDGIPDLIVMFTTGSPALAVLYGNGDGTFQSPTTFQDARIPIDFAVGDVNNDGRMDVVMASQSTNFTAYGVDVFLGAAQTLSILQGSGQTAGIGTAFSSALQVHAAPKTAVTFSAPLSGPSGAFGASTSVSVTTDSLGNASAPAFTANNQVGTYTVTASAGNFVSVSFNLTNGPGPPASVGPILTQASGLYQGINQAFAPLQAVVLDASNNPVPNVIVTFTAPASGASVLFQGGTITATGITNTAGIATSPLPAPNGTPGTYFVLATANGVASPGDFQLTNWPDGQFVVTSSAVGVPGSYPTIGSPFITLVVDGVPYTGTHVFNWTAGDQHTLSTGPPQLLGNGLYDAFLSWSDGGAATHVYTVPEGAATITANFQLQYELIVNQATGGTVTPATGFFDVDSPITITATPDPGYAFTGFTGTVDVQSGVFNPTTNSLAINLTTFPSVVDPSFTPLSQLVSATVSHTGSFTQGQDGATYSILVSNGASGTPTVFGEVTVTEVVPAGLILISMTGAGWNCSANTCTRFDSLAPGASYPAITATVNVAWNAPSQVTNHVATGGVVTSDVTAITSLLPAQTITFGPLSDQALGSSPPPLSATASSGLPVSFASKTPTVCTVSGNMVTLLISGGCSITATQAGNATYAPAAPVTQDFTVLFNDISPSASYAAAVDLFAQYGITAGCGNDDFCANGLVTRAEMAVFIITGIFRGADFGYSPTPHFADVQPGAFGFKWIQAMYELGITAGCGGGNYCPDGPVTRDDMAVFIIVARFGTGTSFSYSSTPDFNDVPDSGATAPYFKFVQRMEQDRITAGCAKAAPPATLPTYCPAEAVTRAQMAVFMMVGLFNQFLPAGTPMITGISPSILEVGASGTYTITGVNTSFAQGTTTISPIPGVTIGTVTVNSPTSLTVQLTAAANATPRPYTIVAITNSEEDVLPNSLTIQ